MITRIKNPYRYRKKIRRLACRIIGLSYDLNEEDSMPAGIQGKREDLILRQACSVLEELVEAKRVVNSTNRQAVVDEITEEPAQSALELIGLRDKLLLLQLDEDSGSNEVSHSLYHELGKILELENILEIEQYGVFDDAVQKVIELEPTLDPALDRQIYKSLRPGYRIGEQLLRPQDVIVYTC